MGVLRQTRIGLVRFGVGYNLAALEFVRDGLDQFVQVMKTQRLSGPKGPESLAARSGRLRASVKRGPVRTVNLSGTGRYSSIDAMATVGEGLVYGRIHEYGGIIRARRAPYLMFRTEDGRWHRKKRVRIPARMGFRKTWARHIQSLRIALRARLAAIAAGVA